MHLSVRPDDLGAAAALTAQEAAVLEEGARLVVAAGRQAAAGLGAEGEVLRSALAGYAHVEGTVAVTLAEAASLLGVGLAVGASEYASAESRVAQSLGGVGGGSS